ncbi:MAG: hypothetical protein H0V26_01335 [Solirubrobacterales bacterium]|nr:hypothetical protein [Solirubrobacterales bacterium]
MPPRGRPPQEGDLSFELIDRMGVDPTHLVVEITETAAMDGTPETRRSPAARRCRRDGRGRRLR